MSQRFTRIAFGIILGLIGLSLLANGAFMPGIFIGGFGFLLLRREMESSYVGLEQRDRPVVRMGSARPRARMGDPFSGLYDQTIVDDEPVREGRAYQHAREAARRAGIDLDSARVYPLDIGLIAHRDGEDPVVYRTAAVPPDVDAVQPYLELYLPMRVSGTVRFEIRDAVGELLFAHTVSQDLARGPNLITPPTRLPLNAETATEGRWQLRVSANDIPIATHWFSYSERAEVLVRQKMQSDGEISPELTAMLSQGDPAPLSLDDLLSDQEPIEPQMVERDARRARGRGG